MSATSSSIYFLGQDVINKISSDLAYNQTEIELNPGDFKYLENPVGEGIFIYEPETRFDVSLLAADAISGMIVANALVRPTKLNGMKAKSIKKRMKDKSFARQVSRENIMRCEEIELSFNEFAEIAVKAMQGVADEIGLS